MENIIQGLLRPYKGEIENFPDIIVETMMDRQENQTGKRDVKVFERNKDASSSIKGFHWSSTKEGHCFWEDVINNHDFKQFFERFPEKLKLKYTILKFKDR